MRYVYHSLSVSLSQLLSPSPPLGIFFSPPGPFSYCCDSCVCVAIRQHEPQRVRQIHNGGMEGWEGVMGRCDKSSSAHLSPLSVTS